MPRCWPISSWGSIPLAGLAAAVLFFVLTGIDSGLERLQAQGQPAYGMADLADGWFGATDDAEFALAAWKVYDTNDGPGYLGWGTWYVMLDLAMVAAYMLALLGLFRRVGASPWVQLLLVVLVAAEVVEDMAQLVLVRTGATWTGTDDVVAWVAGAAALVKWAALAVSLMALAVLYLDSRVEPSPDSWRRYQPTGEARGAARDGRRAWAPLRLPLVLVVVFAVALVTPASDQVPDVLRRWLDLTWATGLIGLAGLALAAVFAYAIWLSPQRIVMTTGQTAWPEPAPGILIVAGVSVIVVALIAGWPRLYGLAVVIIVPALLSIPVSEPEGTGSNVVGTTLVALIRRRARALSAAVIALVGLGCVRAFTEPVFLLPWESRSWVYLIGLVVAAAVATGGAALWYLWLRSRSPGNGAYFTVAGLVLVLAATTWIWELGAPRAMGAFGVLCLFFAVATVVGAELSQVAERQTPLRVFRVLNLTRTPLFALLVVWFVVASVADPGGYHDVRVEPRNSELRAHEPAEAPRTLDAAFTEWLGGTGCVRSGDDRGPGSRRAVPMVFVAAAGGGIRAAYWSASVLNDIAAAGSCAGDDRFAPIFAVSGISGGSLGALTSVSPPPKTKTPVGTALGADHLAPTVARWLFTDLPRSFLGFGAGDRAALLERSWEDANSTLAQPFSKLGRPPLLLLNGTAVETGCRISTAQVELGAEPGADAVPECRAPEEYASGPSPAVATLDLVDFMCAKQEVNRSTAALLSARFPFVSPSGRIVQCAPPLQLSPAVVHVVDGGYLDGTGAAAILDTWRALEPKVEEQNAAAGPICVVPVFVEIDNHYQAATPAKAVAPRGELVAPAAAYRAVNANRDSTVRTAVQLDFKRPLKGPKGPLVVPEQRSFRFAPNQRPGVQAPLGWVLSKASTDDLDDQRAAFKAGPSWAALTKLLRGGESCSGYPASDH